MEGVSRKMWITFHDFEPKHVSNSFPWGGGDEKKAKKYGHFEVIFLLRLPIIKVKIKILTIIQGETSSRGVNLSTKI